MRRAVFLGVLLGVAYCVPMAPSPARAGGSDPGYVLVDSAAAPLHGATVGSPVTIRLQAPAGAQISKAKLLIDNQYVGEDTAAPWEWTTYITSGARALKVRATTSGGDRQAVATLTAQLTPLPAPPPSPPEPVGPYRHLPVTTSAELVAAVATAQPGDVITLADGAYETDALTANASGTAEQPITLTGSRGAVITSDDGWDGGSPALRLDGAAWWRITGLTVAAAKKGIMLDGTTYTLIEGVRVTQIGHEGIHLRRHSSDNWIVGNEVDHTGLANPGYGEGIYIGSAVSNWPVYTDGAPDRSDRNTLAGNWIHDTTAESVDIKEGTTGGVLSGNTFDGSAIAGANSADSWIDIKGNAWLIEGNTSTDSPGNGIEIHTAAPGWGGGNWITGNTLAVNSNGAGVVMVPAATVLGNIIRCDNTVTGAGGGLFKTTSGATLACVP